MDQLELVDGKLYLVVAPPSLLLGPHAQVDGQLHRGSVPVIFFLRPGGPHDGLLRHVVVVSVVSRVHT